MCFHIVLQDSVNQRHASLLVLFMKETSGSANWKQELDFKLRHYSAFPPELQWKQASSPREEMGYGHFMNQIHQHPNINSRETIDMKLLGPKAVSYDNLKISCDFSIVRQILNFSEIILYMRTTFLNALGCHQLYQEKYFVIFIYLSICVFSFI